jgi:hypothetical protein
MEHDLAGQVLVEPEARRKDWPALPCEPRWAPAAEFFRYRYASSASLRKPSFEPSTMDRAPFSIIVPSHGSTGDGIGFIRG